MTSHDLPTLTLALRKRLGGVEERSDRLEIKVDRVVEPLDIIRQDVHDMKIQPRSARAPRGGD